MTGFGEELRKRRKAQGMSLDDVAMASDLSKTYIANIENNKPHPVSGALPQPTRKAVEALALAVQWPIPDALFAAGYAPTAHYIEINNMNTGENLVTIHEDGTRYAPSTDPAVIQKLERIEQALRILAESLREKNT